MEYAIINTPLGKAKIEGSIDGISSVVVLDREIKDSHTVPEVLKDCVTQFDEYFNGTRQQFSLKLNPEGTEFQKRVW